MARKIKNSRYRKVSTSIHNDAKFRSMGDGKCLVLTLLTHPKMTSIGAARVTISELAMDMGWDDERTQEAFGEAFAQGFVKCATKAPLIIVPRFLEHNTPENPNVVRSWERLIHELPECQLLEEHWQEVKAFVKDLGEPFAKALPKGYGNTQNPEPRTQNPEPLAHITRKEAQIAQSVLGPESEKKAQPANNLNIGLGVLEEQFLNTANETSVETLSARMAEIRGSNAKEFAEWEKWFKTCLVRYEKTFAEGKYDPSVFLDLIAKAHNSENQGNGKDEGAYDKEDGAGRHLVKAVKNLLKGRKQQWPNYPA